MNIPLFYEPKINKSNSTFLLSEESSKHIVQVLRMKELDTIHLTNGQGVLCTAAIQMADKKKTSIKIENWLQTDNSKRKIIVAVSLLKNSSRFEWMLEKLTELGVSEIVPIISKRTERNFFREDRLQSIVVSAMLQSQQTWLTKLHNPTNYKAFLANNTSSQKLIAHCEANKKTSLQEIDFKNEVSILIGPEGDFTNEEITEALQQNYLSVMLGNTRLRTETAAVAAASVLCISYS